MIALPLALLALATAPAAADAAAAADRSTEPTAAELVARNRAATGGGERKAESAREHWLVRSGGLTGTLDVVRAGGDTASTLLLGPFRTERGVLRGERWHQNENGQTVVERTEPSQAERTVSEGVARVRAPVDAWVVSTTYASGHVLRSYYDPRTYLVVRTEKSASGHTIRTNYDDFRADARGRIRATHYYGQDDRFGSDFDYRLETDDEAAGVSPSEVAIPADARSLVDFPAGAPGEGRPSPLLDLQAAE